MKKKVKTPLLATAKAIATKLRIRITKGLRKAQKQVPEAFTAEPHPDPAKEAEILDRALRAMPPLARGELEKRLPGDPGPKAVGDTVFVPFIGSEREEAGLDVKTTQFSVEKYEAMQKVGEQTCGKCFGWGTVGTRGYKCRTCKGTGHIRATHG